MARRQTVLLLALLTLTAAAPLSAGASLPPPLGTTERIGSYYLQIQDRSCSPYDPALQMVSVALPSHVTTSPAPGGTQYAIHLESLAPAPGCPTLDVAFTSSIAAWPTTPTGGFVSSPCGTAGWMSIHPHAHGYAVQVGIDLPAACGAGITGHVFFYAGVQPLHPSPYVLCAPAEVLLSCVGASEWEETRYACPNGQRPASTDVTLLLSASRYCDHETGEDVVVISPIVGVAWIEARRDSCVIRVSPLGVVDERAPCPEGVGAALYGVDWGNMLP